VLVDSSKGSVAKNNAQLDQKPVQSNELPEVSPGNVGNKKYSFGTTAEHTGGLPVEEGAKVNQSNKKFTIKREKADQNQVQVNQAPSNFDKAPIGNKKTFHLLKPEDDENVRIDSNSPAPINQAAPVNQAAPLETIDSAPEVQNSDSTASKKSFHLLKPEDEMINDPSTAEGKPSTTNSNLNYFFKK